MASQCHYRQALMDFDDSHTQFIPPDLVVGVDFGFQMQMIGDDCYVVRLKQKSDAETKGLKVGDLIYSIEGFQATRDSLWKIAYSYFLLLPPPTLRVTVQDASGSLHELTVAPAVSQKKARKIKASDALSDLPKYYDLSPTVLLCRMPDFELSIEDVDSMMKRVKGHETLILDLRGNPGGFVSAELRLLGHFFETDIKVGDEKERKKTIPRVAKTRGANKLFTGQLLVIVDSKSGSAAEVFARVIQLNKRGTVFGDTTAGHVMVAIQAVFALKHAAWDLPTAFYGASITIGDLIMTDGKSLEKTGVTPDQVLLPNSADLLAKRDPVLARVAELAGVMLDPLKAATLFPATKEDEVSEKSEKKN